MPPRLPAVGSVPTSECSVRVIEGVALVTVDGVAMFACVACGHLLGSAARTYRFGCRELDIDLTEISELFTSPLRETGEQLVFRRYLCPALRARARRQTYVAPMTNHSATSRCDRAGRTFVSGASRGIGRCAALSASRGESFDLVLSARTTTEG